jgi:ATP-binding cassette, subfamily B, bacterial PglK
MKEFFKHYFALLDEKAKKQLPSLMGMFIASSLLDVIGIGLIGFFLALISNPQHFLHYLPFGQQALEPLHGMTLIYIVGGIIILAFLFKAVIGCLIQKRVAFFGCQCALRLKIKLMKAYQHAPYTFHLKQNSAYLINRFNQADTYVTRLLVPSLTLLSNLLIALFVLGLLLVMHPIATIALVALFSSVIWLNSHVIKKKARTLGEVLAVAGGEMIKSIHHALNGLKEIRVIGTESYFLKKLESVADRFATAMANNTVYQMIPRYAIEALLAVFVILLCLVNLTVGTSSVDTVAFVGIFVAAGVRLLPTVTQLANGANEIRFSAPTMILLSEEFERLSLFGADKIPLTNSVKMKFSKVLLDNVTYRYEDAKTNALSSVNLAINKGQSVGVIGTSGAGKSTLVNLLLGFLTAEKGSVLVDGKPISDMRAWLNNFAYIPQNIFLLDDTLAHNITFGIAEEEIDKERILKVIQMAQLTQVVKELPKGLDTLIGEGGVRLSGGQRQRVALARAFYHERDIIVMDEATSSLDNETEKEVMNAINALHGKKTLIVIAHRLTTVEHCDVIVKLEAGRVKQVGNFQDVVGVAVPV